VEPFDERSSQQYRTVRRPWHGAGIAVPTHGADHQQHRQCRDPNYKARDIDFNAALQARIKGASTEQATAAAAQYRVPVMPSLDGNTVEMGNEQVAFSQNAVGYSSTLSIIAGKVDTVKRAIKGE
jgi:flagellar basal-body rod protein FlgB